MIPQAQRSPSGYRLYTQQHLAALKTVKSLVRGYGGPRTSAIMQALHRGDLSAALAIIDERHAELARKRLQVEQTLFALRLFAAGAASPPCLLPTIFLSKNDRMEERKVERVKKEEEKRWKNIASKVQKNGQ